MIASSRNKSWKSRERIQLACKCSLLALMLDEYECERKDMYLYYICHTAATLCHHSMPDVFLAYSMFQIYKGVCHLDQLMARYYILITVFLFHSEGDYEKRLLSNIM